MRLKRMLSKSSLQVYLMELFIVILGITIAYQVNVYYEQGINRQLELNAIENLKKENEINIQEFKSLEAYRKRITSKSERLFALLRKPEPLSKDSAEAYIFWLVQTSTPDLQQEASNFYLSSNYGNFNLELKNELLALKTYFQELMDQSESYKQGKSGEFMSFLRDAVDFDKKQVVDLKKLRFLSFKNILWNQTADEYELNRLYRQATQKLDEVQQIVEGILEKEK